ncbi:hypothetical protein BDV40DRAFT_286917 [Aspergillus tamarii]|uniref:Choline monooxygenase, chloroplastic n=1 Tax=Aspergillus tamarii TaxID=41984 RepID=A0A5N6V3N9_ASPTM|nr:hypothetical protein BDV40DRAFT_286917 [Aspergillus tamarii]
MDCRILRGSGSRALPVPRYHSSPPYQLERRVIFSKKRLLANLRGFHNVCRHHAYPVVNSDSGSVNILTCKCYGWPYGLNGKLAKAHCFDSVSNFENGEDGLYSAYVHVDQRETPTTLWNEGFLGADTQDRLQDFNMTEYKFDHTWNTLGNYIWKTLVDNYNECYHCGGSDMKFAPTCVFPNAPVTLISHYCYIMREVPTSAATTSMQYELFRHKDASDKVFKGLEDFFKQVENEDKNICHAAQRNLNAMAYINGVLRPLIIPSSSVIYFQTCQHNLVSHREGKEMTMKSTSLDDEIHFCAKLEGCGMAELAW